MAETKRISDYELLVPRHGRMLVDASIYASPKIRLEDTAVRQLIDGASIPTVSRALATPDIHQGYGVPIGSVLGMEEVVVPAAVGFDINCGMRVLTTDLRAEEVDTNQLAASIRRDIPLGEGKSNVSLPAREFEIILARGVSGLLELDPGGHRIWELWDPADERPSLQRMEDAGSMPGDPAAVSREAISRGRDQLATLGGGNHFIELQIVHDVADKKLAARFGFFPGQLVVMIHSGSRGLGHQVGGEYMKLASKTSGGKSPVPFLELSKPEGRKYIGAMHAAANFAFVNRQLMALLVKKTIFHFHPNARVQLLYDVPHNIAKFERHGKKMLLVHRKGATRAFGPKRMASTSFADTGQPVLIPGSMGTSSYILAGIDAVEHSLDSVNHGAGRTMSRSEAAGKWRKGKMLRPPAVSDDEFAKAMEGITLICENMREIREEAPQAYKDIDVVMETVLGAGLARAVVRTRPLAVLKG
jgi:tRNA-splicing ligase RtcB